MKPHTKSHMRLSTTGAEWVSVMRRMFDTRTVDQVIQYAADCARWRGGRQITREDLNDATEAMAKETQWPQEEANS